MINKIYRFPALALLLMAAVLLAACGAQAGQTNEGVDVHLPGEVPVTGAEFDELFINMMEPHHEGAVEMARIAQERSTRPEILQMANGIIELQAVEIDQMRAWKQEWYPGSEIPSMSDMPSVVDMEGMGAAGHGMDMQAEVDALRNAPEPFDLAFIDAMIAHHQSAIEAAELGLEQAGRPEITTMAQQIIADQQREIDQLMAWRQAWFPDAAPASGH